MKMYLKTEKDRHKALLLERALEQQQSTLQHRAFVKQEELRRLYERLVRRMQPSALRSSPVSPRREEPSPNEDTQKSATVNIHLANDSSLNEAIKLYDKLYEEQSNEDKPVKQPPKLKNL